MPRPPSAFGALVGRDPDRALRAAGEDRRPVSRRGRAPSARRGASFTGSSSSPSVLRRDGTRLAGAGFDAVIGNPPWDMIRADTGSGRRALARPLRHGAGPALHARRRRLPRAVGRAREPLPAVRRAGDRADAPRRPHRPGAPVGPGHRPRQRGAATHAALAVRRRRDRRHRQPPRRLSDSSQRPLPAAHRDARLADRPDRVPARRRRPAELESDRGRAGGRVAVVSGAAHAGAARAALRPRARPAQPAQRRPISRSSSARRRSFRRSAARPGGRCASGAS